MTESSRKGNSTQERRGSNQLTIESDAAAWHYFKSQPAERPASLSIACELLADHGSAPNNSRRLLSSPSVITMNTRIVFGKAQRSMTLARIVTLSLNTYKVNHP